MYNSIQHFNEFGVKEIEKTVKNFIANGKDIGDLVMDLQQDLFKLGRDIITEVLEDMDEYLRESYVRKQKYEVVRKDPTRLLTTFGNIEYNRTYFKPKEGGKRKYLVDEIVGINPHDRVSTDVVINAVKGACEKSYSNGGKTASYIDEISKQAVMDKIHNLEVVEPEVEVQEKKEVKILYVEADEDHVPLQVKKKDNKDDKKSITPKLVYVHEGYDNEKSTQKRKVLKNKRYFGGVYSNSEELWLKVADYIERQYNIDSIENIYLSGDGASWIKQGLEWLPKSRYVLDKFHLEKYIKSATGHLKDKAIEQALWDAVDWPDKKMLKKVFSKILEMTKEKAKISKVRKSMNYILNNWKGIEIRDEKRYEIIGCSAEGHVSHIFSDRLSSRPRGWSKKGIENMSKLLIYKKNGGKIYDLVMAQKLKELKEKKRQIQYELIRHLKTEANKYGNRWRSTIPVFEIGKKTGLYNGLRSIIG